MSKLLSSRRYAFSMISLLIAGAAASAACSIDVTGVGTSSTSSAGGAGGAKMVCAASTEVQPCYTGAEGTEGKGTCKSGQKTCNADGSGFGDCMGEVLPAQADDCMKSIDATCDGKLTCPCTPGEKKDCYDGVPATTKDVGICKGGTRTCDAQGNGFGDCVGEVKPGMEDCAAPADENCDGKVNEPAAGCVCDPTVKIPVACMADQTGECAKGTQLCAADGKSFGDCTPSLPGFEDCLTPEDENCDGMPAVACSGSSINAAAIGGSMSDDSVFDVASDKMGNIFLGGVAGSYDGSDYAVGAGAAYITKLNENGVQAWKNSYPALGGYSVVRGVAVDGMGNVLLIGEFRGTISVGGASLVSVLTSIDVFVIKLDMTGATQWSKSFGGPNDQFGAGISVAANGDVFITGTMNQTMSFGANTLTANGSGDVFVAKLDAATGAPKWSKNFGDDGVQYGRHVATTFDDDVVVTGQFKGNIDFGAGNLGNAGKDDVFLAKLDGGTGDEVWAKRFGDGSDQVGYRVAADGLGNIVLTGDVQGGIDFGAGSLNASGNSTDIFVARFGPDGAYKWGKVFGDNNNNIQSSHGLAVDGAGNVLVTGAFKGSIKFAGTTLTDNGNNGSWTDVFVAKLKASDGSIGWAYRFGDTNDQVAWAAAADPLGNVIIGGTFKGTIDFTPPAGLSFTNNANYDAFWAKLAP